MSKSTTVPTAGFALQMLSKEIEAKPGENVVLSPLSISIALGMVATGARTNTYKQMAKVLGLPASHGEVAAAYGQLLAALKRPGLGVTLKIANAIFARTGYEFVPDFLAQNIRHFGAKLETLDFADESALDDINGWVSKNTKRTPKDKEGMITKILEELDPEAIMYLLNALVFKGEWTVKFKKSETKPLDFTKGDGTKVTRNIMYRRGDMAYQTDWKDKVYSTIVLPFGESQECRQVVIAPQEGRAVQDVLAVLTAEKLVELCGFDYESEGELWLPQMQLTYENNLNDSLIDLGMSDPFNGGAADLSGLYCGGGGNAHISEVKHKVVFNLDEEGAEGAAVTSVGITLECCRMPFAFHVDRDFLAFTVTKQGDIKFAKYVTDPKAD